MVFCESTKLRVLRALVPYLRRVLRALVPHVPRALPDLVIHVSRAQSDIMVHVPHTLHALLSNTMICNLH